MNGRSVEPQRNKDGIGQVFLRDAEERLTWKQAQILTDLFSPAMPGFYIRPIIPQKSNSHANLSPDYVT
uniref:Uncharacterized protein n=1 Tax=Panagrolaimus sp. JU765 TaxID=591449 RepID=A0AC34RBG0_9BILA